MRYISSRFALGLAASWVWAALATQPALATIITPSSYTATPGQGTAQGGGYNYFDDTGSQLTDGVLGGHYWGDNLGNGPAYEWVAWFTIDPVLTFNFGAPVNISQVTIDFNRNGGISLPSSVVIGGTSFTLTGNELPSGTRGSLNFAVALNGVNSVQINLSDFNNNNWIFVDEVQFSGSSAATPEPGTLCQLGLAMLMAGALRLPRSRKHAAGRNS